MEKFLNILYPKRCPVCHGILSDRGNLICQSCEKWLHPIVTDYCLKCGKPVKAEEELCGECRKSHREFDRGRSVFFYNDKIRMWKPDLIVPVPMHPRKQRERGFNQAADLAEKAGGILKIPMSDQVVKKTKATRSQKKLNAAERKQNLRMAFQATERLDGLRILVIDDVYTTGSTIEAMAHVLKAAGADKVFFVTLCTGQI